MKITINDYEWEVMFVPEKDEHLGEEKKGYKNLGNTVFDKLYIAINKDVKESVQRNTLIHELVHAYVLSIGVNDCMWDEEEMCKFVGNNLITLYKLYKQICNQYWR